MRSHDPSVPIWSPFQPSRLTSYFLVIDLSDYTCFAGSLSICRILKGNLAPGGAVAKITGKEGLEFTGKARTFDTEDAFVEAVEKGEIKKGEKTVAVLRYLGPKGGPGESVSHGFSFSTSHLSLDWGLELEIRRSMEASDTNVSTRSIPFPIPSLVLSSPLYGDRSFLFCFSVPASHLFGRTMRTFAGCFFPIWWG